MADNTTSTIFTAQQQQGRLDDAGVFPKVVLIDSVSYCNLLCSMCVHKKMTRPKGIMPWNLFTRIIDEVAAEDKDARVWMVFFGEALILKRRDPSIFDMIAYAKGKGLTDVVLNSNANLLDDHAARGLINAGLDAIYIGLDAFTPETYAKVRVGGNYRKTVDNILHLIELKKEMRAAKPEIFVQFVEMDSNRAEKEDFIRFWNSHGVKVKIRPKVSWAGMIDAPNLVLGNEERWPCYWAMRTMSITDTGKVVTCAVDLDARFIAGDITKQTLKEVWNGTLKELRRLHNEKRFGELPENCRDCRDWQSARADYHSINS
ncbi:MAG: radical SAM protein [Alphaproteobacteria bacterium]|uniref:Radical SAM protein n=1 Tax=Candidatus Nitrobium versatile TaxID=2884831 RepID=A0A953JD99_9BACT|nr:radical SAM protein [Candidatus Nitrobium versatile]